MKPQTKPLTRPIAESLESRRLLSGDVVTQMRGGDLILRGDDEDNQILITQPDAATTRITGLEDTTIDGLASVDLPRFTDDLVIRFQNGGEDHVELQGPFELPDDLQVRLREGLVLIEGSGGRTSIGDDVRIRSNDADVILRNEVKVGGDLSIRTTGEVQIVSSQAAIPDFAAASFDDSLIIDNPYFPLVVGSTYTYEAEVIDDDTGEVGTEDIIVEVLADTLTVAGVEVRVVRDRVYEEGLLIEDTFDWYGQDNGGNVWYFGENVTNYEYDDEGNLLETDNDGSWEAGVEGAQAGVIMEAVPRIGHRYHQEFAPGNVLDHAEGVAIGETTVLDIATFNDVYRTEESSVVEPFGLANKLYAPGVGTIMEFDFDIEDDEVLQTTRLVGLTLNGSPVTQALAPNGFAGTNAVDTRSVGGLEIGDDAAIHTRDAVILQGVEVGDRLHVGTWEEPIVVVESVFGDKSELWNVDTITLRELQTDGFVRVGGGSDIVVFESDIAEMKGQFSRVDNSVIVRGSMFDVLTLDGGGGDNKFEDLGDNVFGELKLKKFVQV